MIFKNPSISNSSKGRYYYTIHHHYHNSWILLTIFLHVFTSSNSVSSATQISYAHHCASFVPEEGPNRFIEPSPWHSFSRLKGFYSISSSNTATSTNTTIDDPISINLSSRLIHDEEASNSLVLQLWGIYPTRVRGLFSVQANLILHRVRTYYHGRNFSVGRSYNYPGPFNGGRGNLYSTSSITFSLNGYWSESSGQLCVVGSGRYDGDSFKIPAFLKLHDLHNSTKVTSLITGTLESSVASSEINDPKYFNPISVLLFPKLNYEYSLVSEEFDAQNDVGPPGLSFDLLPRRLCSLIFSTTFDLKYTSQNGSSPLGRSLGQYLPSVVWFNKIECLATPQRLRLLIKFPNGIGNLWSSRSSLDPKTTLVGEGFWDAKKNQLNVVACRFLDANASWAEAHVGDCSIRLSLKFPAVWTIGKISSVVGSVWSNKSKTELDYFDKIRFESSENYRLEGAPGLKYEYTQSDKVRKWCPRKNVDNKGKIYPDGFSYDMRFDMFVKTSKRNNGWGYARPLSVGNLFYLRRLSQYVSNSPWPNAEPPVDLISNLKPMNISYRISIKLHPWRFLVNESSKLNSSLDIDAEGIYDATTGSLCMVGCRNVGLESSKSSSKDGNVDCEILVRFQFPPRNSKENSGYINGIIESKRKKSDPLYFVSLELSSAAYVSSEVKKSIMRTDVEIIMALISNTLACVFAVSQLFHLRKNPNVLPFVSITMLLTQTGAYTIPLMLDLKYVLMTRLDTPSVLLAAGRWLETKEVIEGAAAVILFLLQARLLQLTWSARSSSSDGDRDGLRIAEKEATFVTLPFYAGGAFFSIFFTWRKRKHDLVMLSSTFFISNKENPFWDALKSYADFFLDGFLLPQIVLNLLRDSKENALSSSFYTGTTLVRILPHVYGLYRAQNSGFFVVSTAWDIIIPFGALLFATIIYLQQRFGGRFVFPFRSKESCVYEKVHNVGDT